MCLAIPGQIIEFVDEPNRLAQVDVAGVQPHDQRRPARRGRRRRGARRLGAHPRRLRHLQGGRGGGDRHPRQLERMGADYEQELEELKASVIE